MRIKTTMGGRRDSDEAVPAEAPSPPWYRAGLRFECTRCGHCCSGTGGYVWVSETEILRIAERLGRSVRELGRTHLRRVGNRYALLERPVTGDCVLLREDGSCSVYEDRPSQCRRFPWWSSNLQSPEAWDDAAMDCEGIGGEAPLVTFDEIESARRR